MGISMAKVEVYCTGSCPYCDRALRLLNSKKVSCIELRIDLDQSLRDDMVARSGRTTVPQIFVDEHHIGGFDDLSLLEMDGELDELLNIES